MAKAKAGQGNGSACFELQWVAAAVQCHSPPAGAYPFQAGSCSSREEGCLNSEGDSRQKMWSGGTLMTMLLQPSSASVRGCRFQNLRDLNPSTSTVAAMFGSSEC